MPLEKFRIKMTNDPLPSYDVLSASARLLSVAPELVFPLVNSLGA